MVIDKQTFETIKVMRAESQGRNGNMFDLVYRSRGKNKAGLKGDVRLKYFSFVRVINYSEVQRLAIYSALYIAASSANIALARPLDSPSRWPFEWWVTGGAVSLVGVMLASGRVFKARRLFGPPFLLVSLSGAAHLGLLLAALIDQDLALHDHWWVMFLEGMLDCAVQFYIFYMAPTQIARKYRLTQEVTPAGTILSVNMAASIYVGTTIEKCI